MSEVVLTPQNIGQLADASGDALRIDQLGRVWHEGALCGALVNGVLTPVRVSRLGKYRGRLYGKGESTGVWYEWDYGQWHPLPAQIDMSMLEQ